MNSIITHIKWLICFMITLICLTSCAMIVTHKPPKSQSKYIYKDIDVYVYPTVREIDNFYFDKSPLLENKNYLQTKCYDIIDSKMQDTGIFNNVYIEGKTKKYINYSQKTVTDARNQSSKVSITIDIRKTGDSTFLVPFFVWFCSLGVVPVSLANIEISLNADVYVGKDKVGSVKNFSKYHFWAGLALLPFQLVYKSEETIQKEILTDLIGDMVNEMYMNGAFNQSKHDNINLVTDYTNLATKQINSIEEDIPVSNRIDKDRFAVIFGLEIYPSKMPNVRFATNDATWFREYASKTLGIPDSNIYFNTNDQITKNEFDKVFGIGGWLDKRITAGKSEVIFYYAGHGVPAKDNKAYLVPYDGDPNYANLTCYPVEQIYNSLNRMKLKHSLVIMDACFTGMNRDNQPLIADARPLFIKTDLPRGFPNLSILAGAASDQMSNAYTDKKHGLFSYFLMKGMQGSADVNNDKKLTLKELGDYVKTEVSRQAGFLDKEQTPELSTSVPDMLLIEY